MVVFDIDGVLADHRHRLHLIKGQRKDYDTFYDLAGGDPVFDIGIELVWRFSVGHPVVYSTGRPRRIYEITRRWLDLHAPSGELVMRADGDYRKAAVHKAEVLLTFPQRDIELVVDDDPLVCETLSGMGYPVLQAMWGRV